MFNRKFSDNRHDSCFFAQQPFNDVTEILRALVYSGAWPLGQQRCTCGWSWGDFSFSEMLKRDKMWVSETIENICRYSESPCFHLLIYTHLFMLVSRSATDFCVLIFSTATLSNLLMSLVIFLVASVSFSTYRILPAANSDCFVSSFTIWISLFILHWLLWLGLPILCWIKVVRVDILVLILIL